MKKSDFDKYKFYRGVEGASEDTYRRITERDAWTLSKDDKKALRDISESILRMAEMKLAKSIPPATPFKKPYRGLRDDEYKPAAADAYKYDVFIDVPPYERPLKKKEERKKVPMIEAKRVPRKFNFYE